MNNKCLYCYKELSGEKDFHEKCSRIFFGTRNAPVMDYTLDQMSELAKQVVERSIAVTGVQAKLSMTLVNRARDRSDARLTVVGTLGGNYIFKPPMDRYPEMPQNEHVTMRMAESFGIRVVHSSLIRLRSGELSYITRRLDRGEDGTKIHMIDMFQVLEAFDKYKSSMEKIGKALSNYSSNTLLDKLLLFELTVFCFLTGNSDMHLKNFSMIESASGWILSPAYDLLNVAIINPEDKEELALTLEGKKNKLSRQHFILFGKGLGLTDTQVNGVFERYSKKEPEALSWIYRSFLSTEMKKQYVQILNQRHARLYP